MVEEYADTFLFGVCAQETKVSLKRQMATLCIEILACVLVFCCDLHHRPPPTHTSKFNLWKFHGRLSDLD